MVRVACWQVCIDDEEGAEERRQRIRDGLETWRGRADLVVLPELWAVGYFNFDDYARLSEGRDEAFVAEMRDLARRGGFHLLPGSFVERQGDGLYNTTVLIDPSGNPLAWYRKRHLFRYGSREGELLRAGEEVGVAATPFGGVGLSICYDLRFPELYREMVFRGAEILTVVAAWPRPRIEHWQTLNVARAIENQCYVVAVNCAGQNRGVELGGCTMVVDPLGRVVAGAGPTGEELVVADLDMDLLRSWRQEYPALADASAPGARWGSRAYC